MIEPIDRWEKVDYERGLMGDTPSVQYDRRDLVDAARAADAAHIALLTTQVEDAQRLCVTRVAEITRERDTARREIASLKRWDAIETCPTDGSWFLGYLDGEIAVVRNWRGWEPDDWTPTHWMPLPVPPGAL